MNERAYVADARALLDIQAKCREWGEALRRNGWDSDKMAAANTPEAKAMEMAVMGLIRKHGALLTYCRNDFARDPSTALDRAFDYIGIYLGRGPEALKHAVGLPECLTLEVAQPNVAEPCREPTFIVQLVRWAQKLADEATRDRAPAATEPTQASDNGSGGPGMPSLEDMEFFQEIAEDIRANPDQYREAGEWLDSEYSDRAFHKQERDHVRELIRKERASTLAPGEKAALENRRSWPRGAPQRMQKTFLMLRRFTAATRPFFDDPPAFPTNTEARRILLMTWLMTDTDADKAGLGLTEFERWPWKAENDEAHIRSRRFASDWWRYPSEGYEKWGGLTRRAWATISREQTGDGSAKPPAGREPEQVQGITHTGEAGTDAADETAPFAFYRNGDWWVLRFNGQGTLLIHQKGLTYISRILAAPGKAFDPAELMLDVAILESETAAEKREKILPASGARQFQTNKKALWKYRRRLEILSEEEEEARGRGDVGAAQAAEREREGIEAELSRSLGLGDRIRAFSDESSKVHDAVTKAVRRALKRIAEKEKLRRLWLHLDNCLEIQALRYTPDTEITWKL